MFSWYILVFIRKWKKIGTRFVWLWLMCFTFPYIFHLLYIENSKTDKKFRSKVNKLGEKVEKVQIRCSAIPENSTKLWPMIKVLQFSPKSVKNLYIIVEFCVILHYFSTWPWSNSKISCVTFYISFDPIPRYFEKFKFLADFETQTYKVWIIDEILFRRNFYGIESIAACRRMSFAYSSTLGWKRKQKKRKFSRAF